MKKSLIVLATTAVLASSLISTSSFARGFGGLPGRGGERPENVQGERPADAQSSQQFGQRRGGSQSPEQRLLRLTRVLDLSDEQVTAIEAIQEAQKEQAEGIREAMKVARESLRALGQAETYNEGDVATLAEGMGDLVTELIILKTKSKFDVFQVLTAEQEAWLEEMRNAFGRRHQDSTEDITVETS